MVNLSAISFLFGIAAIKTTQGFVAIPQQAALSSISRPPNNVIRVLDSASDNDTAVGVEAVSLAGLGDDHEAVGEAMSQSVAAWLDSEWMTQEVHARMGTSVKQSYVTCRCKGIAEVAEIMTQVTDDLYEHWSEYDADAFVNAWDVGNYVADYLISKSGSETCGCSTKIV